MQSPEQPSQQQDFDEKPGRRRRPEVDDEAATTRLDRITDPAADLAVAAALISALAERKLREIRESVAAHEVEQGPGPAALPLALIAHARQVYADEDGFPRALLLASAENPEAFAGFNAFLKQRLAQMEDVAYCPGAGAMLTFATLGLLLSRTLGFHCLEGAELEKLFDAMESAARSLPKPIPA